MSKFELSLRTAQLRQRRFYLLGALGTALGALIVALGVLYLYGTVIAVTPKEAAPEARIRVTDGAALAVGNRVYGMAGAPGLLVSAPGYFPKEVRLRPADRGGTVDVVLLPLPGRIRAVTEPARDNARWTLDGQLVGRGESIDLEVEAGAHSLAVDSPWHPVVETAVEVAKGSVVSLDVALAALPGRLNLASEPAGALVAIDKEAVGSTPLTVVVPTGRYAVEVSLDGFGTVNDTIELTRDRLAEQRNYRLRAASGTLQVAVEPGGGTLLLNGRRIEPNKPYEVSSQAENALSYMRDGWGSIKESVKLNPGERREVVLRLSQLFGRVEIEVTPSAAILVDGRKLGEGKATLTLPAVSHRIELRRPGYRSIVRQVTPDPRRPTVIRETLASELQARIAEAPRHYRNPTGMELVLFEPKGEFALGAPRSQEGQRANEFERQVVLNKRFYAAKTEVTNQQFKAFRPAHPLSDTMPVTNISWSDAARFCNWLSERENLTPFYRGEGDGRLTMVPGADGYRLLTEAEWEWLARRAGRAQRTVFTWGDDPVIPKGAGNIADETANGITKYYVPDYVDGQARLAPVASYPAEASGLHDMTGNASEWVHDYYVLSPPRPGVVFKDPTGPTEGDVHVIKGSSWQSGTRTPLRAAYRDGLSTAREDVGFRVGRYLYGGEDEAN